MPPNSVHAGFGTPPWGGFLRSISMPPQRAQLRGGGRLKVAQPFSDATAKKYDKKVVDTWYRKHRAQNCCHCLVVDSIVPGLKLCTCMCCCQGEIKPEFQLISVDETDVRVRRCSPLLCISYVCVRMQRESWVKLMR